MMRSGSPVNRLGGATRFVLACVVVVMILSPGIGLSSSHVAFAKRCTLVELRPGYPGFQGFVTGVQGIGDHACLEDLERKFPRFSKKKVDAENRRAAKRLGISGSPDVWTWENWLAIEGEKGQVTTCYSCALLYEGERSNPRNTGIAADDPRLLVGTFGDTWLMSDLRNRYGAPAWLDPVDDYWLRALVTLGYGEPHLNAIQLLDAYELYGQQWITESMKPGGRSILPSSVWGQVLERGGYFEIPKNASPEDQIFAVVMGFYAVWAVGNIADDTMTALLSYVKSEVTEWQVAIQSGKIEMSLGDYLISEGAGDLF